MKLRTLAILTVAANTAYAADAFVGEVSTLPPSMQKTLKAQLSHANCPAIINHLVMLKVSYYGMDNLPHTGNIIVNKAIASETLDIFKQLYVAKYHIQQITPYTSFPQNTFAKNNATVGYYCATLPIPAADSAAHAEGKAIDINPLMNPYVADNIAWPVEGTDYIVRSDAPGVIRANHKTYNIFIKHGWTWGGSNTETPDYMHFAKA